jgi:GNAT superfamily N-acetyltransferase
MRGLSSIILARIRLSVREGRSEVNERLEVGSTRSTAALEEMNQANKDAERLIAPDRSEFLADKTPLVMTHKNKVIAHAGIIPVRVLLSGKLYTASWFIDFAVLPEFQRQGLGMILMKRWTELSDFCVGFPNEMSVGAALKYGWLESRDTFFHFCPIKPFQHPKFSKYVPAWLGKTLNAATGPFFASTYRKYASSPDSAEVRELSLNSLANFMSGTELPKDSVQPIRDSDYMSWRLLNSPDKDKYHIFSLTDACMVVKMCRADNVNHIDILLTPPSSNDSDIRRLVSTLALWGRERDYSFIRHYTSNKNLSDRLKRSLKPVVRHPRFMFYSTDGRLLDQLRHSRWNWQLIDSDFEEF